MSDLVTNPVGSDDPATPFMEPLDQTSPREVEQIPNLEPFEIEPIFLAPLYYRKSGKGRPSPLTVGIGTALIMLIALPASALIDNSFFRPPSQVNVASDIWRFLTWSQSGAGSIQSMPYLRDYPSLALTLTVALVVPFVYGIFLSLSELHKTLDDNNCIRLKRARSGDNAAPQSGDNYARKMLISEINQLNARLKRRGKRAPLKLLVIAGCVTYVNFALKNALYPFLGISDLYNKWWAQAFPLHAGGIAWIFFGSVGIYMICVEADVGISYVRFLGKCRAHYQFGANRLNPDGFYGWSKLREVITYQELGFLCSAISAAAMFFVLPPAIGELFTATVIAAFMGIVLYVFVSAIIRFRRQVKTDREERIADVIKRVPAGADANSIAGQVATLVMYRHLEAINKIPPMPIRQSFLLAGIAPILAALIGLVGQLIKYLLQ